MRGSSCAADLPTVAASANSASSDAALAAPVAAAAASAEVRRTSDAIKAQLRRGCFASSLATACPCKPASGTFFHAVSGTMVLPHHGHQECLLGVGRASCSCIGFLYRVLWVFSCSGSIVVEAGCLQFQRCQEFHLDDRQTATGDLVILAWSHLLTFNNVVAVRHYLRSNFLPNVARLACRGLCGCSNEGFFCGCFQRTCGRSSNQVCCDYGPTWCPPANMPLSSGVGPALPPLHGKCSHRGVFAWHREVCCNLHQAAVHKGKHDASLVGYSFREWPSFVITLAPPDHAQVAKPSTRVFRQKKCRTMQMTSRAQSCCCFPWATALLQQQLEPRCA